MKSLFIALAMYSKLPAPSVEWDKKSLSWALCWFPVIGVVIGALLYGWFLLCAALGIGPFLRGAVSLLIPIAVSGAIHLDGFCDTSDALGSHQDRARKLEILGPAGHDIRHIVGAHFLLEILKDSHTGAFAIICCTVYLLLFFAAWCEVLPTDRAALVLALGPVLSRGLSGLAAVTQPNARGSGLLATFTQPMDASRARIILGLWLGVCAVLMVALDPWTGTASLIGAALSFLYYIRMSRRQFGGITGDLAGFFLQICECAIVLAVILGQKAVVLL